MPAWIPVLFRGGARLCGRCGSALADDGHCAACMAREQARNAFIIPRPSQLGHGSANVASEAVDDLKSLLSERQAPGRGSPAISGLRARLEAVRSGYGNAVATLERSPERFPAPRYDATSRGLGFNHPVASAERSLTASEYRATLAARRRTTASPDGGGRAGRVIRTPALRQPSLATSPASPPLKNRAQIFLPTAAENGVVPAGQQRNAEATAPETWAPAKKSTAPRRKRSTTATKRASVMESSAAAEDDTSASAPDSQSGIVAWTVGRDAGSVRLGGMWRHASWVVIVGLSALIGASVPILLMR